MAKTYLLGIWIIIGKESVGPNYDVTDKFDYHRAPTYVIGTEIRRDKNTIAKFDHYHR
jgi:hypothetical protein